MKRLMIVSIFLLVSSVSAFAQTSTDHGGGMMGNGWGWGMGFGFGWVLIIIIVILVIFGAVYMMKRK